MFSPKINLTVCLQAETFLLYLNLMIFAIQHKLPGQLHLATTTTSPEQLLCLLATLKMYAFTLLHLTPIHDDPLPENIIG